MRLEGWIQHMGSRLSFETAALRPPQDEAGGRFGHDELRDKNSRLTAFLRQTLRIENS